MPIEAAAGGVIALLFSLLLPVGLPISLTIGIASLGGILTLLPFDVSVLTGAQRIFTGINAFQLLAIPFFILAGMNMNAGGMALRLVRLAWLFFGRLPCGLAQTNVVGNMLFGCISGSAVASGAAIGTTMAPLETKAGYDKNFSAAVNIASAPAGLLIPPSNSLVIYSLVSGGTSVTALFMAGYLPGLLWGLSVMAVACLMSRRYRRTASGFDAAQPERERLCFRSRFKAAFTVLLQALPCLALIVIVIGGIVGGLFTVTEGAAVSAVYSFALGFFVYKTIRIADIPKILVATAEMTGVIVFLISVSAVLSWVLAFTNLLTLISNALLALSVNPIVLLLIMNAILLFVGTFMDLTPAILIFTPLFLPIATRLGMDPVHFGIMLIFNLCIGNITPPVGNSLFVGCKVGGTTVEKVIKPLIPFYIGLMLALTAVTFIPQLSLWLPKLLRRC